MRLPILNPKDLTDEQKPLYDDMRAGMQDHFKGFVNMRDDGALLGPWNPWLREPRFGKPVWELVEGWLKARGGKVTPRQVNVPAIRGALPNEGYAAL